MVVCHSEQSFIPLIKVSTNFVSPNPGVLFLLARGTFFSRHRHFASSPHAPVYRHKLALCSLRESYQTQRDALYVLMEDKSVSARPACVRGLFTAVTRAQIKWIETQMRWAELSWAGRRLVFTSKRCLLIVEVHLDEACKEDGAISCQSGILFLLDF